IAAAADRAFVLDVDPDTDHNRVVVSLAGRSRRIIDGLMGAVSVAVERIDLPSHRGVHPRVGVADVVPIVPLGSTSLDSCRELALARAMRASGTGLRGVQALAFGLPGEQVQLSMNLFRIDETTPADVVAELARRGVAIGAEQLVGLCPARAASPAADGRLLEG